MPLSDVMTSLMDKARKITGLTDKLNLIQLTGLMGHFDLHVNPNLLKQTVYTSTKGGQWSGWNTFGQIKLAPGTYTFSWQAKTNGSNKAVRLRLYDLTDAADKNYIIGPFAGKEFPLTGNRQSYTFTLPNDGREYDLCGYGSAENKNVDNDVTFYNCKLEVGDLATPLQQVGGGN